MKKYITHIGASNFKGIDKVEQPLSEPVALVLGQNYLGKTARLDAVRVGLLGYHPKLGRRNQETFKLASSIQMSVGLTFNDDSKVAHQWNLRRGSVMYEGPDNPLVPPVLLDVQEYLGLSAREKVSYVFARVNVEKLGFSKASVTAKLKNIKPEVSTEQTENVISELLSEADVLDDSVPMQEWMDALLTQFREKKKAADGAVKAFQGFVTSGSQMSDATPPANVEAQLKKKRDELESLNRNHASNVQSNRNAEDLQKKIHASQQFIDDNLEVAAKIDALEKSIKEADQTLNTFEDDTPKARAELQRLIDANVALEEKTQQAFKERRTLQGEMDRVLEYEHCPTCKQPGESWKKSYQKTMQKELDTWDKHLAQFKTEKAALDSKAKDAGKTVNEAIQRKERHEARMKAWNDARENLYKLRKTAAQIDAAKLLIKQTRTQPLFTPEALATEQNQIDKLRETIANLEETQRKFIAHRTDSARAEEARQRRVTLETEVEITKLAIKEVEQMMAEMVNQVIQVIVRETNAFTEGLLESPLEYRDGMFGRFDGKNWIGHDTFSGTEEMIAYAAMSVVLARESEFRIVMMDELGRVDRVRKNRLIERMKELVNAGTINQFIGIDVDDSDYEEKTLKHVCVTRLLQSPVKSISGQKASE